MDDVYNLLNHYLKNSKNGINETIARHMLASLHKIPQMRATDVAKLAHTSASSVVRFCQELGYDGYIEFKEVVDDYWQNVQDKYLVPHIALNILGTDEEYADSLKNCIEVMQECAYCAMLALDRKQLIRLAREVTQYKYVYMFGAGLAAQIVENLRIRLARSGKIIMTMVTPNMDMPLNTSREETLAVVISQHGRIMRPGSRNDGLLDYLQKYCAKTWLVTQENPQRKFRADEIIHIIPSSNIEVEIHTMTYFEAIFGECCRVILEEGN